MQNRPHFYTGCFFYTGPPSKSNKYKQDNLARLGVSWSKTVYVNEDTPNLGFHTLTGPVKKNTLYY